MAKWWDNCARSSWKWKFDSHRRGNIIFLFFFFFLNWNLLFFLSFFLVFVKSRYISFPKKPPYCVTVSISYSRIGSQEPLINTYNSDTVKPCITAVFNWVSKVISQLLWFCIVTLCDWPKIARHYFNQSEAKLKPIVTCSHAFSRAWRRYMYLLRVLIGSSDCLRLLWLVRVITSTLVWVLRHRKTALSEPVLLAVIYLLLLKWAV